MSKETQNNSTVGDSSSSRSKSSRCSGDSFASLITDLPFSAKSWRDVRKRLKSLAWIECDNPECQKWRQIPTEMLKNRSESDKWFCHQNSDPDFNSCSIPEEDILLYDQLAERSGLKYLESQLSIGALVWAKMNGYCSWPSVVTPEPGTHLGHLCTYEDGEIASYHVEFLGQPHSHGWVSARNITIFTPSSVSKQRASSHQQETGKGRIRGRGRKPLCPKPSELRTVYRTGVRVEHGIEEAMAMLHLSPNKRLDSCTYVPKRRHLWQYDRNDDSSNSLATEPPPGTSVSEIEKRDIIPLTAEKTNDQVSQFTSFDSSLENSTKEERFMLDVEMYKRNERAFIHDVTRFMIRNGMKQCKEPFWQNQTVSLFRLFLAVHEHGGYAQVTIKKKWAAVYREVTESPCHKDVYNSTGARVFYYRHLYPYELYVHGKDFITVVAEIKEETCRPSEKKSTDKVRTQQQEKKKDCVQKQDSYSTGTQDSHSTGDGALEAEEDVASDSLKEMLQALEEHSKLDFEDGNLEDDINITFYDDSTPKGKQMLLTDFEPQGTTVLPVTTTEPNSVAEGASSNSQQVYHFLENVWQTNSHLKEPSQANYDAPQIVPSADESNKENHKKDDKDGSTSACSQQMLQELDVLQNAISFIHNEMD